MNKKIIWFACLFFVIATAAITIYLCNKIIADSAKGNLYTDTKSIPFNKVGLLLGTAKFTASGRTNLYYDFRIQAATRLIKEGKIKYLVISGDNSRQSYNEPASMRTDLIDAGIDSSIIYLDYAGFRTFDSMVRLKEIFGQDTATVISQQFHNERAIYTGQKLGISVIGFNAADVSSRRGLQTQAREKLARVKTFFDFWFGNKPKFLGTKIIIPS